MTTVMYVQHGIGEIASGNEEVAINRWDYLTGANTGTPVIIVKLAEC